MEQDFQRMMDKTNKPTEHQILRIIGEQAQDAWLDIIAFIEDHYNFEPETVFYGTKYGWTIRYRRSGRTLCSLFPEKDGFTVLITLGKKESETVLSILDDLSSKTRKIIEETKQLRDGRWLWIRLRAIDDTDDIKKLIQVKKRPKKKSHPKSN